MLKLLKRYPGLGKINITSLTVPAFVQNGSEPTVLLDCEYIYDPELDKDHVLKWFLDDNPEQVYQWIPSIGSRTVSEILQPFLDMQYTAPDPDTKYRSLRLRNPTVEVGGRYTCYVGSLESHDSESASMIIYAPAKKLEVSYSKLSPDTIAVNCEADEVYPEPKLRIFFDREDSALFDTDEDSGENGDSVSHSISRGNSTSMSKSDDNKKSQVEDETSEGGVSKPDSLATNSATVSEDGSQETNENTNSEKSAELNANATIKDTKKQGKSIGTSESVGPDKSEGTSESKDIVETTEKEDDTSEESEELPSKKVIAVKKGKMYRVRIRSEIKMKRMDKEAEFECVLKIPGTDHEQIQKIKYLPAEASQELLWLLDLLKDLELEQKAPIYFHQDNQSCLKICSSEKVSSRTKHIATKIHHLKDLQKKTVIKMIYCPTGDMKADILTKPLPRPTFEKLRYNLVMSPHSCRGLVG
ncbi:hypothetical protein LAZ67_2002360 [Cordylochernes scorpioides]|uniref:Ig-like domain-containing protein n=1 Tax=Cordylochernes scorpioides TaxID=51811 RepID=A0ABY6K560_9ARAC|nr:hypothetical protein LAZ67_2002360 [Cordylochernes scorpioides]